MTEIDAAALERLKSATARALVPLSCFDQTWRFEPGVATSVPCLPSGSWSTATTSALVRMALVVALIERMSLPAMSGAARIAHMPKCDRSSSADIPLPTSNMSGSFQWPGAAYWASGLSMSMRPVNEPQLALMSKPMRHMLQTFSSSTEQLGGTQEPWP